jgi:hypothetical protein
VACQGQPAAYTIANEPAFLRHMQQCCERTAVAPGMLGTLAGWASGSKSHVIVPASFVSASL